MKERKEGPESVWDMKGGLPGLASPAPVVSIVARFSTRPSAHETSFTLSLSLSITPSLLPSLPRPPLFLVFLDLCSQYFSTDRKWESHLLQQQHSQLSAGGGSGGGGGSAIPFPFSLRLRCCSCAATPRPSKKREREREKRREKRGSGGRDGGRGEEYGRVQLNGKKDDDDDDDEDDV